MKVTDVPKSKCWQGEGRVVLDWIYNNICWVRQIYLYKYMYWTKGSFLYPVSCIWRNNVPSVVPAPIWSANNDSLIQADHVDNHYVYYSLASLTSAILRYYHNIDITLSLDSYGSFLVLPQVISTKFEQFWFIVLGVIIRHEKEEDVENK